MATPHRHNPWDMPRRAHPTGHAPQDRDAPQAVLAWPGGIRAAEHRQELGLHPATPLFIFRQTSECYGVRRVSSLALKPQIFVSPSSVEAAWHPSCGPCHLSVWPRQV